MAAQVSGRLVSRTGARPLLAAGADGVAAGAAGLVAVTAARLGLWLTLTAFFIVVTSVGLVLPNAAALALDDHGSHAGSAAALLGFGQFLVGGLTAPLAGVLGSRSAWPAAIVMAAGGAAAVIIVTTMARAARLRGTSGFPRSRRR